MGHQDDDVHGTRQRAGRDRPQIAGQHTLSLLFRPGLVAFPNPFTGRAVLRYNLPSPGHVRLAVYDITGRCRKLVVDQWQARGDYSVNLRGDGLTPGIYMAKLIVSNETGSARVTRKLLLAK